MSVRTVRALCAGVALLIGVAAAAQAPRPAVLDRVAPGAWTLHEVGSHDVPSSVCLRDPALLLQVAHGPSACTRTMVDQQPRQATVQYICPGAGRGRTTISIEDDDRVRIQTQGILRGAPFDLEYEARRTGTCAAGQR